ALGAGGRPPLARGCRAVTGRFEPPPTVGAWIHAPTSVRPGSSGPRAPRSPPRSSSSSPRPASGPPRRTPTGRTPRRRLWDRTSRSIPGTTAGDGGGRGRAQRPRLLHGRGLERREPLVRHPPDLG